MTPQRRAHFRSMADSFERNCKALMGTGESDLEWHREQMVSACAEIARKHASSKWTKHRLQASCALAEFISSTLEVCPSGPMDETTKTHVLNAVALLQSMLEDVAKDVEE